MKKISQVFKRIAQRCRSIFEGKTYVCDPQKAVKCGKQGCWEIYRGPCKCTGKRKYAKIGSDGKPIIARDEDLWNEEYLEYQLSMRDQTKNKLL